ncbi:protein-glutamine gamma-glutamyltransferase E-like [Elgaria multicarinata webbii]|uniref:protein-glutamine gamma-glutamyltransferase E-like n=1 Tax=Elgaria multicarinata webbii TaxID=159646 RepID=UPI002FCD3205
MFARQPEAGNANISGEFNVESPPQVGEDVKLILRLRNHTSEIKSLTANVMASTIIYTGNRVRKVWNSSLPVILGPKEEKAFPLKISYAEYRDHLTSDNMIQATALCQVEDGSQALVERVIVLDNPPVLMKVLGQAKVGEEVKVEVMFTNPLEEELKDCVLRAEGSGLMVDVCKIKMPSVKAKKSSCVHLPITPSKSGTKHLVVNFSCDKFQHINAFETIIVDE